VSEQVDKLVTFGQIALEQGWHDQARKYFEQALDLDVTNREALKGLLRVGNVLGPKMETPVEPIMDRQIVSLYELEQKRGLPERKREAQIGSSMQLFQRQPMFRKLIILASVQVLLLCLCTSFADIFNPTPKTPPTSAPRGAPMPAGPVETIFMMSNRDQLVCEVVDTDENGVGGGEVFVEMAELWGTVVDVIELIETEPPEPTAISEVNGGWLCDRDERGEITLWSKPAAASQKGNYIIAIVGMSVKSCVDGILLDETTSDGNVFYMVRVGDDQGWVDADYFYPTSNGKPH